MQQHADGAKNGGSGAQNGGSAKAFAPFGVQGKGRGGSLQGEGGGKRKRALDSGARNNTQWNATIATLQGMVFWSRSGSVICEERSVGRLSPRQRPWRKLGRAGGVQGGRTGRGRAGCARGAPAAAHAVGRR